MRSDPWQARRLQYLREKGRIDMIVCEQLLRLHGPIPVPQRGQRGIRIMPKPAERRPR